MGMALQFPGNMERVLVQLASALGKSRNRQIFIGTRFGRD